jgi:hypothetical protein
MASRAFVGVFLGFSRKISGLPVEACAPLSSSAVQLSMKLGTWTTRTSTTCAARSTTDNRGHPVFRQLAAVKRAKVLRNRR